MAKRGCITKIEMTEVVVPAHPDVINSPGLDKPLHMLPSKGRDAWSVQFDELPKVILRLHLDDGTVGLGECYRDHSWDTLTEIAAGLFERPLADFVLQDLPIPLCREYDGFECALWDARAKQLGIPLHELLGGAVRDKVRIGAWSSHRSVDEIGPWAKQYQDQGFDCIKFKTDLEDDVVGWCRAIDDHAPGMKVILDPNQRWDNLGEAKGRARQLEQIGNVLLLEDPIPRWMLQDWTRLRTLTAIPLYLHVSLPYIYQGQRPYDAANAIAHGAVDGFNFNAGLAKFRDLAAVAATAGLPCWHGSEVDLGILEAMYVHQSAAASACIVPSDIFGRMIRQHDLLREPLRIDPPFVHLPQGPGLGVELDDEAIERFLTQQQVVE